MEKAFTAVCSLFVHGQCTRKKCMFAHSANQLRVAYCQFGDTCNKQECLYLHPSESYVGYEKRVGFGYEYGKEILFDQKCNKVKKIQLAPISPVDDTALRMAIQQTDEMAEWMDALSFTDQYGRLVLITTSGKIKKI